jgi:hypothetical protein
MEQMLAATGIHRSGERLFGESALRGALGRGALVSLDFAKHHALGSAMDEQGRIYVGESFKAYGGGKDWMTLSEMVNLAGSFQGGYTFANGPGGEIKGPSLTQLRGTSPTDALNAAADAMGLSPSERVAFVTLMAYESGSFDKLGTGSASAYNPSGASGLLQMMPGTFAAYAQQGHGDIWNPVDNAMASIAYVRARYGSAWNIPGIRDHSQYQGYARGGVLYEPVFGVGLSTGTGYSFAEKGSEEWGGVGSVGRGRSGATFILNTTVQAAALTAEESRRVARELSDHLAEFLSIGIEKSSATMASANP